MELQGSLSCATEVPRRMNPSPAKSGSRRSSTPSGLGRGLAGILGQPSMSPEASSTSGLDQLLGSTGERRTSQLRPFILRAALAAVVESFGADGAVMTLQAEPARPESPGRTSSPEPVVVSYLPPSWGAGSGALFELHGRLWGLTRVNPESDQNWSGQYPVGLHHAWAARLAGSDGPVGVAFVRRRPFDHAETRALERSMTSALSALTTVLNRSAPTYGAAVADSAVSSTFTFTASVTTPAEAGHGPDPVVAEVTVRAASPSVVAEADRERATVTGTGRGPDATTAVARAAANACQPQRRVTFAGSLDIEGATVTIVLVDGHEVDGSPPRLGLSIRPRGDATGAAEAVFGAARTD